MICLLVYLLICLIVEVFIYIAIKRIKGGPFLISTKSGLPFFIFSKIYSIMHLLSNYNQISLKLNVVVFWSW